MTILQGNGEQEPINGLAHEWVGSTVTTTDTDWYDRKNNANLTYDNAYTNSSNSVIITSGSGTQALTGGLLKSPSANQKCLFSLQGKFVANNNKIEIGDASNGTGVVVTRNAEFLTIDGSNYFDIPTFSAAVTTSRRSIFILYDMENQTLVKYLYDDSGDFVESVDGIITGTVNSFDLSADQDINLAITAVAFEYSSIMIHYFNDIPSDLTTGLSWMSDNPTLGSYVPWREL